MSQEVRIALVMVVYEETIAETKSYQSLLNQIAPEKVLIYDNSAIAQEDHLGFTYVHDPSNPGVSKAYNYAASWANSGSYTHLLLLDSDTTFPSGAIQQYKEAAANHKGHLILPQVIAAGKVISPFWFKWGKSWYGSDITIGELDFQRKAAINSGMLIPIEQYQRSGGHDDRIPLDWSDIAFCRKLKKLGIKGVKVSMEVRHELSETQNAPLRSAKFRFRTYMVGMKRTPTKHWIERFFMLIWAKLKALKLGLRYKSAWFIFHYSRKLINA